jgi:hypothetical protein
MIGRLVRPASFAGALVLVAFLLITRCDAGDCDASAKPGLVVWVVDTAQRPVCDAVVTARDGAYTEVMPPRPCSYAGAWERAGTYSITAERDGESGRVDGIKVTSDRCHVHPKTTTITITT